MVGVIAEGWLLGVATGPFCFGACAPFLVPVALGAEGWRNHARALGAFLCGRLLAYALFGAVIGWAGGMLQPAQLKPAANAAMVPAAALLIAYGLQPAFFGFAKCGAAAAKRFARLPFALGVLAGLNLCPPFIAGAARLLQVGHWLPGALFFIAFFLGTSVYLLPLAGLSGCIRGERAIAIGRFTALFVGCWLLIGALLALIL